MDGSMPPEAAPEALAARERDRDIVALVARGEVEPAFGLLLERYERKIYRLCCSVLRDPDQAADAAQDSLVRIWKALGRYDDRASLSTWIYAITRNRCLTAIERRRDLASLSDEAVATEVEARTGEGGAGLHAAADGEDRSALLQELVGGLPERYRKPLVLYYYEECAIAEVAGMLGATEGAAKTWIHRARALLLERVRAAGLGDAGYWLEDMP
jgi:RNA polymerase sigma-70 factor, ECF subfamily